MRELMKPKKGLFITILLIIAGSVLLAIFGAGSNFKSVREMRYGIDIRGGVEAVFKPDGLDRQPTADELEVARNVIEIRLDNQNITDREVTIDKSGGYIIVRFPWKSDEKNFKPEDAIAELGEMAQLTFRNPDGKVLVEGKNVVKAVAQKSSEIGGGYEVTLEFDSTGAKKFQEATAALVGKVMSIYMDDKEISSPQVNSEIEGGNATINHIETMDEAKTLAEKINAGALPFSLSTSNFQTISPSLGQNALKVMVYAGFLAFILVCLFMIMYYRLPGLIASLVLVLQMVIQLLALSVPQFSLTLPGIAGVILSLGMAVDANVIISERITEELGKGKSITSAIAMGYKNAFSSVLDGNVTTAIVAIILMIFGSGSMLSFGYTLVVGMIANVFIGVTLSKGMLLSAVKFPAFHKDKLFRTYKEKKIKHFYQKKYIPLIISSAVFILGIVFCFTRGVKLDTQFTGGVVLNYSTENSIDTETVREKVSDIVDRPVTVQMSKDSVSGKSNIVITMAGNTGITPEKQTEVTKAVGADLSQTFAVEPYIGKKALKNAITAIIVSMIFIIIYVWIRFSGLAAGVTSVIALIHDVIVVFFAFVIFGIPLNDAFVAVVLTIIGYSINDTIVLYDRIRENKGTNSKLSAPDLIDKSVTQILGRSINTSLTTSICVLVIMIAAIIFRIESIRVFALPMFFGLISGCYSSMCIAGIIWAAWKKKRAA